MRDENFGGIGDERGVSGTVKLVLMLMKGYKADRERCDDC